MSEKKVLGYYIVPFVKDGLNVMPDFLNAKKMILCKDCKYYVHEQNGCKRLRELVKSEGYCMWAEKRSKDHE